MDYHIIVLSLCAFLIFVLLYRWHNNPNSPFDLTHALLGEDGKASLFKIGQACALVVSTWAFVVLVQKDKLTEYYFYGYMGIWSGVNLVKNIFGKAPDASTSKG